MAKSVAEIRAASLTVAPFPSQGKGLALDPNGQIPASLVKRLPGYEFGYDKITANVTVSSATEATGTTVIACAAHTFDGAAVWAHFFCPRVIPGDLCFVSLFEGATQICRLGEIAAAAAATVTSPVSLWFRMTPSAAAHTFTVTANRGAVDTTIVAHAGGTATEGPTFIRFVKA